MAKPRVLVAGIGNIFFADDGFGCEVASRLVRRGAPHGATVEDFGIRGVHLAYELLDGYDALVLVDAVPMAEKAGTIALIEPERYVAGEGSDAGLDAHTMNPQIVLQTLANLGGHVDRIVIVGCQPERIEPALGLSPSVEAAIEIAICEITTLLDSICRTAEETCA